ncbi:fibronectin type III domain-containing protein [Streptomyces longhuiensis]|uniref:fibronectin type III domain-containing protein n=1 Tax=Streptomyces longhuiensis TaxID=2880933 RepID=UPI001D09FD47|nr:fibronectin type III domain-containing protein [Streptomyces longhuiensis]UDL97546.1 fibronectin type III domain-containing protein [Streptomyces longhuiensis]
MPPRIATRHAPHRTSHPAQDVTLPPPAGLRAEDGTGHVLLTWEPVPGADGYVVHRSPFAEGPYTPLPGGPLSHPSYADTRVEPGRGYWYKVAARADGGPGAPTPTPVPGCAKARGIALATVTVMVDATGTAPPLVTGDGAQALVRAAARHTDDGAHVHVVVWNAAADRTGTSSGSPALDRTAVVRVTGLAPDTSYAASLHGSDTVATDTERACGARGDALLATPGTCSSPLPHEPLPPLTTTPDGTASLSLDVPLPGLRSLRLSRI